MNATRGVGMNLDMLYATVLEDYIDWKDDEMEKRFSSVFFFDSLWENALVRCRY